MFDLVPPMEHVYLPQEDKTPSTSTNLYLRQPYTHAVIELVEVAPPPPRRISSVIGSSEGYSSSSSSYDDDDCEEEEEGWQEEEEACSSYCSSEEDLVVAQDETQTTPRPAPVPRSPPESDSFKSRMRRILLWRDGALSQTQTLSDAPSLKRKFQLDTLSDAPHPPSSKRSRSSSSSRSSSHSCSSSSSLAAAHFNEPLPLAHRRYSNTSSITSAELEMHPCPACDAFFPTLQSLQAHGKATGSEACCVAVEYAFE